MKIVFSKSNTPFGYLIRMGTWSEWNHVAALFDDTVYEANVLHGVRRCMIEELLHKYPNSTIVNVEVPDEGAARRFLESQLGKPYDFRAIFGFISQRDWAEDDKWFCSELVESAILAGGKQRFRERMNRITPQHVWMASV